MSYIVLLLLLTGRSYELAVVDAKILCLWYSIPERT